MDTSTLLSGLDREIFSREDIQRQAEMLDPRFQKTQMRYLVGKMLEGGMIVRVSHGLYRRAEGHMVKCEYVNRYNEEAVRLIMLLEKQYPLLEYRVWELCWLNEFLNHQVAQNKIFLEVENEGCDFVYDYLFDEYHGRILLRPSPEEIFHYGVDGTIIVDRLISEAPAGLPDKYNVPLEKIIVDLFSNKNLQAMISRGDYPEALEDIFHKYHINQSSMLRYARRRNKEKYIRQYFERRTNIKLLKGNSR